MKRWVIVEDRPWIMTRFIQEIQEKAQAEGQEYLAPDILYYIAGEDEEKRKDELLERKDELEREDRKNKKPSSDSELTVQEREKIREEDKNE